jgi:putative membrane protein
MPEMLVANVVAALVFGGLGLLMFMLFFLVLDKLTPYRLWHEILQEHNTALAILVGAIALGMSIIVAAAIV